MEIRSAAKAVIRRKSDGKYLILTSSEWEENPARSKQPDLPGGIVEDGEGLLEGLRRELMEEIGSDIPESDLKLVYASSYIDDIDNKSTTFLLYFVEVESIEITLSWEHEAYEWLTATEVKSLSIREPYPTIFSYFETVGLLN